MAIFKYMLPEHARSALKEGFVKIGTLHGFRSMEVGSARQDSEEGYREYTVREPVDFDRRLSPAVKFIAKTSGSRFFGGSLRNEHPGGATYAHGIVSDNAYIFCMSNRRSEELRGKFGGAGFEICNVEAFLNVISEELRSRELIEGDAAIGKCIYQEKRSDFREHQPGRKGFGWLIKPTEYAEESEVRAIWSRSTPADRVIKPVVIQCKKIRSFIVGL